MKKPGRILKPAKNKFPKTVHTKYSKKNKKVSKQLIQFWLYGGKQMHSLWWETCKIQERQTLEKDLETQVLVIGGGMAGILTAYQLQKSGKKFLF